MKASGSGFKKAIGHKVFLDSLRIPIPAEKEALIILTKDKIKLQDDLYILPKVKESEERAIAGHSPRGSHNHLNDFGSSSMKSEISALGAEHFSKV